jgi:DNA-binding NarL/FixJ family response regulator
MDIVLYSDDLLTVQLWNKALEKKAKICYGFEELDEIYDSIIIINCSAFEREPKEVIGHLSKNGNKVLVLDHNPSILNAKRILKMGAKGYGHVLMKAHFILAAIETIKDGMVWLHSQFTPMLLELDPSKKDQKCHDLDVLTPREKEVAIILKDGYSYKEIADKLSITPRTVKAHAQNIYAKLNVKDKLSLLKLLT